MEISRGKSRQYMLSRNSTCDSVMSYIAVYFDVDYDDVDDAAEDIHDSIIDEPVEE